jgi:hippurate hydrolase
MLEMLAQARSLLSEAIALRRRLHAEPELGLILPTTQQVLLGALAGLGLELETGGRTSAVLATLRGPRPGRTVMLRADMDALPLQEETGLEYASRRDGAMHACGHDAHMAMLVGAAQLLARQRDAISGTIKFLFQPGEEGHGGARILIEEGLLEREPRVEAAFAIHVDPTLPPGRIAARAGPMLASMDTFSIQVLGRGGHASMPHFAIDPVPIAAEIVLGFQSFVTRRADAFDPVVLSVTSLDAGTTHNVIPEAVRLAGTVRSVSAGARERAHRGLRRVARGIAAAHGGRVEIEVTPGYPATVNDPHFFRFARDVASDLFGQREFVELSSPIMGSEDFSYVLERVPGAVVFLGVRASERSPEPLHSNRMLLEESALAQGIALHAAVALAYLGGDAAPRAA